jgi:hypothetical protein
LEQLCAAFNAHDLDKVMTFFAEDCVLEVEECDFSSKMLQAFNPAMQVPEGDKPWGTRYQGKENARKALAGTVRGFSPCPLWE